MMIALLIPGTRTAVRGVVREFNKHVLNPLILTLAGRRYWYAARVEHVGRRSGRAYATPVVATKVHDGFVIPLPYGTSVDWLRNVQAAGGATLVASGRRYLLSAPEVYETGNIFPQLPSSEQTRSRVWRIGHWLKVAATPAN